MNIKKLKQNTEEKREYLKEFNAEKKVGRVARTWGAFVRAKRKREEIKDTRLSNPSQKQLSGLDKGTYDDVMKTFFRKGKKK